MIINLLRDFEQKCIQRGIPILGKEKGTWLYNKIQQTQPKKVLELGTALGYSGIILGSEGAQLITVEMNPELAEQASRVFQSFHTDAQVVVKDGVQHVKELASKPRNHGKFDVIFIDFAKSKYIAVLDDCLKLVTKGGMIIADNITFVGCADYKDAVMKHPQLKTEIISIKDGMSCSIKVK